MVANKVSPIYLAYQGSPKQGGLMEPMPIGLLYVGQALADAGFRVKAFHLRGPADNRLREAVKSERPLFVGFSNFISPYLIHDVENARWLKSQNIKVVWGGIFSTTLPEVPLRSGLVDYIVAGEGERSAVELARAIFENELPKGIPGVGFMDGEEVVLEPQRVSDDPLDNFNFGIGLIDPEEYISREWRGNKHIISLPFSRGCPFRCAFCYNSMREDRRLWRSHSADYMNELIGPLKKNHGITQVSMLCDNVFGKVAKARSIIERLDADWDSMAHLSTVNDEFVDWANQAGCKKLGLGLESGSNEVLMKMNKHITVEEMKAKVDLCHRKGMMVFSSWIGMVPGETLDDLRQTFLLMDHIYESYPDHSMIFNFFKPFPHTEFWEQCMELGHESPQNLDEWARYYGYIYKLLGYEEDQTLMLWVLMRMVYRINRTRGELSPAFLRNLLRSRIQKFPFSRTFMYSLKGGRKVRRLARRVRRSLI